MWPAMGGLDSIKPYRDLGISRLVAPVQTLGAANPVEALDKFGDEVLSKL